MLSTLIGPQLRPCLLCAYWLAKLQAISDPYCQTAFLWLCPSVCPQYSLCRIGKVRTTPQSLQRREPCHLPACSLVVAVTLRCFGHYNHSVTYLLTYLLDAGTGHWSARACQHCLSEWTTWRHLPSGRRNGSVLTVNNLSSLFAHQNLPSKTNGIFGRFDNNIIIDNTDL